MRVLGIHSFSTTFLLNFYIQQNLTEDKKPRNLMYYVFLIHVIYALRPKASSMIACRRFRVSGLGEVKSVIS